MDVVLVGDTAANDRARLRLDRAGLDGRDADARRAPCGAACGRRCWSATSLRQLPELATSRPSSRPSRFIKEAGCDAVKIEMAGLGDGPGRQARERQPRPRDRRGRHPGDGPRRPDAAERDGARRLSRPGTDRARGRAGGRRRARAPGRRLLRDRLRGDPGRGDRDDHGAHGRSRDRDRRRPGHRRPGARVPRPARASTRGTRRASSSASPSSSARWWRACSAYAREVRERRFPAEEHCYSIDPDELERFREVIAPGKAWDIADAMRAESPESRATAGSVGCATDGRPQRADPGLHGGQRRHHRHHAGRQEVVDTAGHRRRPRERVRRPLDRRDQPDRVRAGRRRGSARS